jgi:hypothetical protein
MDTLDALLDIIALNEGRITGRTTLQKLGYFSKVFLVIHPEYRAHYYGPYSATVAETLDDLVAMGFLDKNLETRQNTHYAVSPDWKRYSYTITPDGKKYLNSLRKHNDLASEEDKLKNIIGICRDEAGLDPYILSWAAKVHFILSESCRAMTIEEVQKSAATLNWELGGKQIEKGIALLEKLKLITR